MEADETVAGEIRDLLKQAVDNCAACGNKVTGNQCNMISENTKKSRDILLLRRKEIV